MKSKWVQGKIYATLTLAPGIYALVYYGFVPGEGWCFRSIGQKIAMNYKTQADAKADAEEYLCEVVNAAMSNIYSGT